MSDNYSLHRLGAVPVGKRMGECEGLRFRRESAML